MDFEYDPNKSAINLAKHGIDFRDAQDLWDGFIASFPIKTKGEQRRIVVGKLAGEYWTVVVTCRQETIRIISARRSSPKERSEYDRQRNNS